MRQGTLNRQSEIYICQGVELSRAVLSGWTKACCRLLPPLEAVLQQYALTDGQLHTCEVSHRTRRYDGRHVKW